MYKIVSLNLHNGHIFSVKQIPNIDCIMVDSIECVEHSYGDYNVIMGDTTVYVPQSKIMLVQTEKE